VRSPIAHGRIVSIDVDEARMAPGVVAVFTADDLDLATLVGFHAALAIERERSTAITTLFAEERF
jgi:CO/xanthine dehydrogenase Mo-binding subunit